MIWTLVSALWTSAPAPADAEEPSHSKKFIVSAPPPEQQLVVIPLTTIEQCEADAMRVDRLEPALRACQRDLDAQAGALEEARRQREEVSEQRRLVERRLVELEAEQARRWHPLVWAGIGAGSALVAVLLVTIAVD